MANPIQVVILAAGLGKRMHSELPKVLHEIAGLSLIEHVLAKAAAIAPDVPPMVVFGHQGALLKERLKAHSIVWIHQEKQCGTGHALMQALPAMKDDQGVLVLYGDVPLISIDTLERLIQQTSLDNAMGMITADLANPQGYGRIKREKHKVVSVVEEKDATDDERAITEVNSGIYYVKAKDLKNWLPQLGNDNAQKEYYLTDIIPMAVAANYHIETVQPDATEEIFGVNDRMQLAYLERFYQYLQASQLMLQGVTLRDPNRFDLRGNVKIGKDVVIDVNVVLEGQVVIGDRCTIGPNCLLRDVVIANDVEIKANTVIEGATIASQAIVGPFARLRPGAVLSTKAHIGNFVEVKKSVVGAGSKINHLSYIGDSDIGANVNIGAGTITCNYDGVNKHKTIIEDNAFIGSASQLVAPVKVGEGATIGAGSTITKDAPPHQLTLARAKQLSVENWQRPTEKSK